jgi:uncharacterized membrane protein
MQTNTPTPTPAPTPTLTSQPNHRFLTALWLCLTVAAVVLISHWLYIGQSLRLDEAQSLWQTSHGLSRMYQLVAQDVHVPLYHTLLHFWQISFGNTIIVARYLSLLIFCLIIPSSYWLARQLLPRKQSLLITALLAISPFMNWYGNEARMYMLLTLMTVINQTFFLRILRRTPGAWWGYAITAVLGIYSHYFFAFVLVTQALFFVLNRQRFERGSAWRFTAVAAVVATALGPWLYYVYSLGSASTTRPHLLKPSSADLFNTFSQFVFGFQNNQINTVIVSLWPIAILLSLLTIQKHHRYTASLTYMILAAFAPILAAFAVSITITPFYISRYLIVSLPALYIVMVWFIGGLPRRFSGYASLALIGIMMFALGHQAASGDTPVKEDYRDATSYVSTKADPQDVVVLSAPFTIYPVEYYYTGSAALTTIPQWNRFVAGNAPAYRSSELPQQVFAIKGNHRDLWLILSYDQGHNAEILRYFDTHFERLSRKAFSPGLAVYAFRLRYDIPNTNALIRSLNQ